MDTYNLPTALVKKLQELAASHTLGEFLSEYELPENMTAYQFLHQNPNEFDFGELPFSEEYENLNFIATNAVRSSTVRSMFLNYYQGCFDYALEVADIMQQVQS